MHFKSGYYEYLLQNKFGLVIAETKIKLENRLLEKIIIGCIVFRYKECKGKYCRFKLSDLWEDRYSSYIMTLGVINEFRRSGVAAKMLEMVKEIRLQNIPLNKLAYTYLHVVTYNQSAIKFY